VGIRFYESGGFEITTRTSLQQLLWNVGSKNVPPKIHDSHPPHLRHLLLPQPEKNNMSHHIKYITRKEITIQKQSLQ